MNDTLVSTDKLTEEFFVAEGALKLMHKRLESLVKAAKKVGSTLTYEVDKNQFIDLPLIINKGTKDQKAIQIRKYKVIVTGDRPAYSGWTFCGTVEHTCEGNVLRLVPGCEDVPAHFRSTDPVCDHCRVSRVRRDTYIVRHDDGSYKQVGKTCLKDFLGHDDPKSIIRLAAIWMSLHEMEADHAFGGGSAMYQRERLDLRVFLENVAAVTRKERGYVTRKMAQQYGKSSTASTALSLAEIDLGWRGDCRDARDMRNSYYILEEDSKLADDARAYVINCFSSPMEDAVGSIESLKDYLLDVVSAKPDLKEFEHNLLVAAKGNAMEPRLAGIAAYIIEFYRREKGLVPAPKKRKESTHQGELKKRMRDLKLEIAKITPLYSDYTGESLDLIRMYDENDNLYIWKTASGHGLEEGHTFVVDATPIRHTEYKGTKQTQVNRVTVKAGIVELKKAA